MAAATALDRLVRGDAEELDHAREHRWGLLLAADALRRAAGHLGGGGDCREAGCHLARLPHGPDRCVLAHRLADAEPVTATGAAPPLADAVAAFDAALLDALDAVRACRQVAHPGGECWFSPPGQRTTCGEVLRLAHRTG